MSSIPRKCNRFVILSSLTVLCGCSSFNREWAAAPVSRVDIQGRWDGRWTSYKDGHTGSLKCVVTETSDQRYRAHFAAVYWKLFHFDYVAELKGTPEGTGIHLTGEENLGWLAGGVYSYDGHADSAEFNCNYASKYDNGKFILRRPAAEAKE
jgi:hypothetical protein